MRNDVIIISVTISCIAALPYIAGVVKGNQKPKIATWIVWAVLAAVGSGSAFSRHQTPAAIFTLVTALEYTVVAVLGFRLGDRKFTKLDVGCLLAAFLGLMLLIVTNSPTAAIIIVIIADAVGTAPTIVHCWQRPYEESYPVFLLYVISEVTILTIANFKVFTSFAYPGFYLIEDAILFGLILVSPHQRKGFITNWRGVGAMVVGPASTPVPVSDDVMKSPQVGSGNSNQTNVIGQMAPLPDNTVPTISYQLSSQPNKSGWYNRPVVIAFSAVDTKGGIASCSPPVTLNTDGANQQVIGTAKNFAGESASVTVALNIDQTPPLLGEPKWGAPSTASPKWTLFVPASDSLSGVAGGECIGETDPGVGKGAPIAYANGMLMIPVHDASVAGTHTLRARAMDVAGNWSDLKAVTWQVVPKATPPAPS